MQMVVWSCRCAGGSVRAMRRLSGNQVIDNVANLSETPPSEPNDGGSRPKPQDCEEDIGRQALPSPKCSHPACSEPGFVGGAINFLL